jgi:hypothetical protein
MHKPCDGNFVCADATNGSFACVCPLHLFGSADCSKPACKSDDDCSMLENGYCVQHTKSHVGKFCTCKLGWTGPHCNIRAGCNLEKCTTANAQCNNEGMCKCDAGFTGSDCLTRSKCRYVTE